MCVRQSPSKVYLYYVTSSITIWHMFVPWHVSCFILYSSPKRLACVLTCLILTPKLVSANDNLHRGLSVPIIPFLDLFNAGSWLFFQRTEQSYPLTPAWQHSRLSLLELLYKQEVQCCGDTRQVRACRRLHGYSLSRLLLRLENGGLGRHVRHASIV